MLSRHRRNRSVSAVTGIALLLVVTVVLVGITGVFFFDLAGTPSAPAQASVSFSDQQQGVLVTLDTYGDIDELRFVTDAGTVDRWEVTANDTGESRLVTFVKPGEELRVVGINDGDSFLLQSYEVQAVSVDTWAQHGFSSTNTAHHFGDGPQDAVTETWSAPATGTAVGPIDGELYVGTGETITVYDAASGDVTREFTVSPENQSRPVAYADGIILDVNTDGNVYGLNANNGSEQWNSLPIGTLITASPTVVDTTALLSNPINVNQLSITDGTSAPVGITDAETGIAASSERMFVGINNSGVHSMTSVEATNATSSWTTPLDGSPVTPATTAGGVYTGTDNGTIYHLSTTDGKPEWTVETGTSIETVPALAYQTVYIASTDTLYAIDAHTGEIQWTKAVEVGSYSPAVVDERIYFGSQDETVYAVNASTGTEDWSHSVSEPVTSSPTVVDGTVYITVGDEIIALEE